MGRSRSAEWTLLAFSLAGLFAVAPLKAQDLASPSVAVMGGAFSYDIDGRGDGVVGFGALRFRLPLSRYVMLEPSIGRTRFTAELDSTRVEAGADEEVGLLLVDFQVQIQLPSGRLRPYVGLGAGGVLDLRDARSPDDYVVSTFTLAGGLALDLGAGFGLRAEARGRFLDETQSSALEYALGLSLDF